MKMRIILVLIGVLPLLLGFITDRLTMTVWLYTFPAGWHWFMGLFVLLLWFVVGMVSVKWVNSKRAFLICLNAAAGLALILVLLQEHIIVRYWGEWIGFLSQFFYLPLTYISARLLRIIPMLTLRFSYVCVVAFCVLLLSSFLGRVVGERR